MRLADVEALSFDCYGTLIDWETGIAAVLRPWSQAHGLERSDDELLAVYAGHEARAEAEHPSESYPRILARAMRGVGEQLGAAVSEREADVLAGSVPDWPAFPDSPGALARLAAHCPLIILSNVDRASFAASNQRLGVTFAAIVTAQDVGAYKPSARNFEALVDAARRLGVGQGHLLHVAQSLFHDHIPAKAAGLPTVWIDRRHAECHTGATDDGHAGLDLSLHGRLRRRVRGGSGLGRGARPTGPARGSPAAAWLRLPAAG